MYVSTIPLPGRGLHLRRSLLPFQAHWTATSSLKSALLFNHIWPLPSQFPLHSIDASLTDPATWCLVICVYGFTCPSSATCYLYSLGQVTSLGFIFPISEMETVTVPTSEACCETQGTKIYTVLQTTLHIWMLTNRYIRWWWLIFCPNLWATVTRGCVFNLGISRYLMPYGRPSEKQTNK